MSKVGTRAGLTLVDTAVYLLIVSMLVPALAYGHRVIFKVPRSQQQVVLHQQLDLLSDRIRVSALKGPWEVLPSGCMIHGQRWTSDDRGVLINGLLALKRAQLTAQRRSDGWLEITITSLDQGTQRMIVLAPWVAL